MRVGRLMRTQDLVTCAGPRRCSGPATTRTSSTTRCAAGNSSTWWPLSSASTRLAGTTYRRRPRKCCPTSRATAKCRWASCACRRNTSARSGGDQTPPGPDRSRPRRGATPRTPAPRPAAIRIARPNGLGCGRIFMHGCQVSSASA